MDSDEQPYPMLSSYSPHPTNQNRVNITHQQSLRNLHPAPRQYTAAPDFQDNYGNEPQPSMLHNTSRYRDPSRTVKEEHTYIYSTPIGFRGEMNSNVHHHPTHLPDHNTIRYPTSHPYSSTSNTIRMASSPLELPETRLASGPAETGSADFRYQMCTALQPRQQHLLHRQRHQHGSLPHHQHPNHSLNHLQGGSAFYSPSINYSSQDQEHGSPQASGMGGGLDHPQTHSSLEYDSHESHTQHVPVPPGMVYDSLAVPSHSQQGVVRRDSTMNPHHGSLASINSSNSGSGGGSYHTSNSPVSSIPMSNNHGTTSSMNTTVLGAHISPPYSIGPTSNLRWAGHPSSFDMPGSTATHSQIPTQASTSASSSSLRPSLRHADSDSRLTPPENSYTQDTFHLRTSTSAQTLSSSHSPSPLSDNESTSPGGCGSEMFNNSNNLDDRDGSDQDVESVIRISENCSSAGRKGVVVIRAGEEVKKEALNPPVKKKKKSKMHCCEVCLKKFPRPSGLRTHMNTHSNEKPYPCGFPGCTRSFGVRSNAKRHLRTHGVIPTPASNPNSTDPPYVVGFCTPMIGAPLPSSSSHHQLHSIEGGVDKDFPRGSRLPGDHNAANIHLHHTQDHQGQSDVQQQHEMMTRSSAGPALKLRWMPPSLTTRTNAGSLREVVDEQQMQHWMGDVVEEEEDGEDDDDFAAGGNGTRIISHARRRSGGGYDSMDMDQRLTVSHPAAECTTVYSPPSSESPSTQGTCRPSSSPALRIIASSISPPSTSSSFARSNSSLSPPSTMSSGYGQQQHEIDHITNVGGGGDVFYSTSTENISREYGGV